MTQGPVPYLLSVRAGVRWGGTSGGGLPGGSDLGRRGCRRRRGRAKASWRMPDGERRRGAWRRGGPPVGREVGGRRKTSTMSMGPGISAMRRKTGWPRMCGLGVVDRDRNDSMPARSNTRGRRRRAGRLCLGLQPSTATRRVERTSPAMRASSSDGSTTPGCSLMSAPETVARQAECRAAGRPPARHRRVPDLSLHGPGAAATSSVGGRDRMSSADPPRVETVRPKRESENAFLPSRR